MRLGYSTNSIGDIPPLAGLPLLADLGYSSLAITLDHALLNPFSTGLAAECARWREALKHHGMACVIETGARHLLDPQRKHEPTLVSADPDQRLRRVEFLQRAIDIAVELRADCVSLWAGIGRDAAPEETLWHRLTESLALVVAHAATRGVVLGFEPEPGMFIDTLARHGELVERMGRPAALELTVDIGHLECMGEWPLAERIGDVLPQICNVHLEDMRACRHEHLPLGRGDIDFAAVLGVLQAGGYAGGIHIELPRQAHAWLDTARQSAVQLVPLVHGCDRIGHP